MGETISIRAIWLGCVLVLSAAMLGLFIHRDYGIPWDEPHQRRLGQEAYDYVSGASVTYLPSGNREYGVFYEMLLHRAELSFAHDDRSAYHIRHFINHAVFVLAAGMLYFLVFENTGSIGLAVIAFLLLLLHPRLYADSFYNTKDIPFLAAQPFCYWLCFRAARDARWFHFIALGFAVGLQITLRIMGVLPGLTIAGLIAGIAWRSSTRNRYLAGLALYIGFLVLTLYFTWPYLWLHPLANFQTAFSTMSKYPWGGTVLFAGHIMSATAIPWYYSLVWFGITLPAMVIPLGIAGLIGVGFGLRNALLSFPSAPATLLLLAATGFIAPFVSVIALKSVLYDGWRHLFFVYPAFILLLTLGVAEFSSQVGRRLLVALSAVAAASSAFFIITSHPNENVYFNRLAGPRTPQFLRLHWDLDYWGVSFKQALEHIVANDQRPIIRICAANVAAGHNTFLLTAEERERIRFVDLEDADYFVTNYRDHPADYLFPARTIAFERAILNSRILAIYKLK